MGNAGYAPVLIFLNERFPTAMRATGTGASLAQAAKIAGARQSRTRASVVEHFMERRPLVEPGIVAFRGRAPQSAFPRTPRDARFQRGAGAEGGDRRADEARRAQGQPEQPPPHDGTSPHEEAPATFDEPLPNGRQGPRAASQPGGTERADRERPFSSHRAIARSSLMAGEN